MKVLRWTFVVVAVLVLVSGSLILWVQGVAVPLEQQPPPDPGQVITMPNGSERTLAELLADSRLPEPAPGQETDNTLRVTVDGESASIEGVPSDELDDLLALDPQDLLERVRHWRENRWVGREPDGSDLFQLAEYKLDTGDTDAALALYRSVPTDHPQYPRSQRRIGWDIYTKQLDDPRRGVAFVQAALHAAPEDGNCWQDIVRVYGHTLGLPID